MRDIPSEGLLRCAPRMGHARKPAHDGSNLRECLHYIDADGERLYLARAQRKNTSHNVRSRADGAIVLGRHTAHVKRGRASALPPDPVFKDPR